MPWSTKLLEGTTPFRVKEILAKASEENPVMYVGLPPA